MRSTIKSMLLPREVFSVVDKKQSVNMSKGDGAEITQTKLITIRAITDCEIIIIDAP